MRKKAALKSKKQLGKVFCNDDLPEATRKVIQEMRDIASYAIKIGYSDAKVSGNKLFVNGKTYYENDLATLPDNLKLENVKTRPTGTGIGFQSRHSFLSNFYPCHIRINGKLFTSSEQAYQHSKAIVCERDDTALSIKSTNDPEKAKHLGDKLDTCPEWELKKRAVMKCVVAHKFKQNFDLRRKLQNTAGMKCLECTTNRYWGTGRRLDSPLWNESSNYEGRNELGQILEEIRNALDPPALNCTAEINRANQNVAPEQKTSTSRLNKSASMDTSYTDDVSKQAALNQPEISAEEIKPKPSARDLSKSIAPTQIPQVGNTATSADKSEANRIALPSHGESMDMEGIDSVSLSSVFSDSSDPIDTKNITLSDGRLDLSKLASWKLDSLNSSRIADLSERGSRQSRRKYQEIIQSQNELAGDELSTSTPKCGNISTVKTRKKRKSLKQGHVGSEKGKLNDLLKEMNLI